MRFFILYLLVLFIVSTRAIAEPTVSGSVISWPDDGWYQVQVVTDEGITEVCAGTRSCKVIPGTYIVINHTTGQRFENIIVKADPAGDDLVISGNTLSWPDNGWYQVQAVTGAGIVEVCAGTRFCIVPNGTYIVINHTSGKRYEDVIINVLSQISVNQNTISWPNNGWYQVQSITDSGITEVCAGTLSCTVPDGSYIVINHTTGERFEPVIVNSGNDDPDPHEPPVIRADTWQEILRNVISLINTERALERHASILERFRSLSNQVIAETLNGDTSGTLASLGLTLLPPENPDNNLNVDYACNADGTLSFALRPGVNIYAVEANVCAIGGDTYDGAFNHFGVGREGISSQIDNLSVNLADSTAFALSGNYSTSFDRVGIRRSTQWRDAAMFEQSDRGNYSVDAFTVVNESASGRNFTGGPSEFIHNASVNGSFSVTGDWTDGKALQVTTDLSLGLVYQQGEIDPADLPSQWTSGRIEILAEDGSRLTLSPIADSATSASVDISGMDMPQQVLWSSGYQVRCFADSSLFPDCQ